MVVLGAQDDEFQMGFIKCRLNIALRYLGIGMSNAY